MTYAEKLKDPRWQRRRLKIMERDGWICMDCGSSDVELNVHHRRYRKGIEPWDHDSSDLVTLCKPCHSERHRLDELLDLVAGLDNLSLTIAIGHLKEYLLPAWEEEEPPEARAPVAPPPPPDNPAEAPIRTPLAERLAKMRALLAAR